MVGRRHGSAIITLVEKSIQDDYHLTTLGRKETDKETLHLMYAALLFIYLNQLLFDCSKGVLKLENNMQLSRYISIFFLIQARHQRGLNEHSNGNT